MRTDLIVILILLLIGVFPFWAYSSGLKLARPAQSGLSRENESTGYASLPCLKSMMPHLQSIGWVGTKDLIIKSNQPESIVMKLFYILVCSLAITLVAQAADQDQDSNKNKKKAHHGATTTSQHKDAPAAVTVGQQGNGADQATCRGRGSERQRACRSSEQQRKGAGQTTWREHGSEQQCASRRVGHQGEGAGQATWREHGSEQQPVRRRVAEQGEGADQAI